MARRRYQQGSLILRGKRRKVWTLRWRDDVMLSDGSVQRVMRNTFLGTKSELPTAKMARRRAEQLLGRVNAPDYRPVKTAPFERFVELWRGRSLALRKPYTIKSANYHLRIHLLPRLANLPLDQIDTERVQELVAGMSGRVLRHTILNVLGTLRSILGAARKWGYLTADLTAVKEFVIPQNVKSVPRFFTAEQAREIIEAAEQPWKCLYAIAAMCGLRPGEVLGLCMEDLNLEHGTIHIRRAACFGKLVTTKTAQSVSTVPIPVPLRTILVDYLARWQANPARLLFATRSGRPYQANKISEYRLHPLLKTLGIGQCGLSGFRHTHASLMLLLGASPVTTQRQLRHSDPLTTMRNYAHVIGPEQRDSVEKVARVLCPNVPKSKSVSE